MNDAKEEKEANEAVRHQNIQTRTQSTPRTPQALTSVRIISTLGSALPEQTDGTIRLVILSDTHGRHWELPSPLPSGDVLMHLGDVANKGNLKDICSFTKWLKKQQRKQQYFEDIVIIEGNHDRNIRHPHLMDLRYEYQQADDDDDHRRVHFLQDQAVDVVKNWSRIDYVYMVHPGILAKEINSHSRMIYYQKSRMVGLTFF